MVIASHPDPRSSGARNCRRRREASAARLAPLKRKDWCVVLDLLPSRTIGRGMRRRDISLGVM
jgi:hypothetical protein